MSNYCTKPGVVYVCKNVCVCERGKEREKERERVLENNQRATSLTYISSSVPVSSIPSLLLSFVSISCAIL